MVMDPTGWMMPSLRGSTEYHGWCWTGWRLQSNIMKFLPKVQEVQNKSLSNTKWWCYYSSWARKEKQTRANGRLLKWAMGRTRTTMTGLFRLWQTSIKSISDGPTKMSAKISLHLLRSLFIFQIVLGWWMVGYCRWCLNQHLTTQPIITEGSYHIPLQFWLSTTTNEEFEHI